MPRLKLTLQYDGTAYAGWQVQPNGPSIQAALQAAFATIQLGDVPVTGASRTDAGVHATGQVCHVDVAQAVESPETLLRSLNGVLPRDIRVSRIDSVADDFHARYHATAKAYRYLICPHQAMAPLLRHVAWHHPAPLDPALMARTAETLPGTHDFRAFQAAGSDVEGTTRTMFDVRCGPIAHPGLAPADQPLLAFDICGDGFLYKMVRALVGTLVDLGARRLPADALEARLRDGDRDAVGRTAPAHGLTLRWVDYGPGPHTVADPAPPGTP